VIKTASFGEAGRGEICHEAKIGIYLLTSETENCWWKVVFWMVRWLGVA